MTDEEAQQIVTTLTASHPGMFVRLSPQQQRDTMGAYRAMLRDLDYDVANAAVATLLATLRYMPTPAEIRGAALSLNLGQTRAGGEAWGDVLRAIRRYGYMRQPGTDFTFEDPVVARCVAALSWVELCSSENAVADRARFIELYDQLAVQERQRQLTGGLAAVQALEAKKQAALDERSGSTSAGEAIAKVLKLRSDS